MWISIGVGFLIGLSVYAFVAFLLGYTVKFENMELEEDDE